MSNWYVLENGNKTGPLSDEKLQELVHAGRLTKQDYVWTEGFSEWAKAESLDGINWARNTTPSVPTYQSPPLTPVYKPAPADPIVPQYVQPIYIPQSSNSTYRDLQEEARSKVVSLGDWVLTLFLISIPVVGLVLLLIWAFDTSTPQSKSNFAKAALIWGLVAFMFYFVLFMGMGMALSDLDF